MKRPRITKGMSVSYARAKQKLFSQETPVQKMDRLRNAHKKAWDAAWQTEKEFNDFVQDYEAELSAFLENIDNLRKHAETFEDKMDGFSILDEVFPKDTQPLGNDDV